ncbi:MAG TPA: hypothetical protein VF815_25540 [Myxococcaceae bacterium]|jgi:hypothetical protein
MNPRVLSTLLSLPLLLVASPSLAQGSDDRPVQKSGFSFSARFGAALPLGNVHNGDGETSLAMSDIASGMIPVHLDGGLFLGSSFYVGAYFEYGRLLLAQDCPETASCSATNLRFGASASLHLPVSDTGRWSPWVGGGIGYEIFKPGESALNGLDFHLQGGADYHVSGPVWFGPFAMFTLGKYSDVNDPGSHHWLMGGVRILMRH